MSVEIQGFNGDDIRAVGEAAHDAGRLCVAQGMSPAESFTAGARGGQYAGELVFTALREMGIIPPEGIDNDLFRSTVERITDESIEPATATDDLVVESTGPSGDRAIEYELLLPSEVAKIFKVNRTTVTRWARSGQLNSIKTLGGHRRFRRSVIEETLRERLEPRTDQ